MDRNISFDMYDNLPQDMRKYMASYGMNFSEKLCRFAVSLMKKKDSSGKLVVMDYIPKSTVDELLTKYGVVLENDNGYNSVYIANYARADYYGSSLADEKSLALFICDYIDDKDFPTTEKPFRHFLSEMYGKGIVINWIDMI